MYETHVYELLGQVVFRRSGNRGHIPLRCEIVRTRGRLLEHDRNDYKVQLSVIVSGYETLRFGEWFDPWLKTDNMAGSDFQSGRPIDVAVPVPILQQMIATGQPVYSGSMANMVPGGPWAPRTYRLPVVAVRINDRWVEPIRDAGANEPMPRI